MFPGTAWHETDFTLWIIFIPNQYVIFTHHGVPEWLQGSLFHRWELHNPLSQDLLFWLSLPLPHIAFLFFCRTCWTRALAANHRFDGNGPHILQIKFLPRSSVATRPRTVVLFYFIFWEIRCLFLYPLSTERTVSFYLSFEMQYFLR